VYSNISACVAALQNIILIEETYIILETEQKMTFGYLQVCIVTMVDDIYLKQALWDRRVVDATAADSSPQQASSCFRIALGGA
jgi:hypothetical protein